MAHTHPHQHTNHPQQTSSACCCQSVQNNTIAHEMLDTGQFHITEMDCPTEETLIRQKLGKLAGVKALEFNLLDRVLTVTYEPSAYQNIIDSLSSVGMTARPVATDTLTTVIRIEQMDCPTEEALIRKKLEQIQGISRFSFNLMLRTITVSHEAAALNEMLAAIKELGFDPVIQTENMKNRPQTPDKASWWPLILAIVLAASAEFSEWLALFTPWLPVLLALTAILISGLGTYKKGWIALINGNLNINALMSIAVTGAFILKQWPEAAMVMTLFSIAERIEAASLDRARNAIHQLLAMTPEQATTQQPDGSWKQVDAKTVSLDALVRVRPGERVPLDGTVTTGQTSIDQAPITGESIPVEKNIGDQVFAGTINQTHEFEYRVTAPANESTLARIIRAVESAQGSKAPTQRFVDQFARIYTPIVFILALLIAVLPPLLFSEGWLTWVYKALVLLVIACPCALVISTPVSIVSGLAAAAKKGILVKGGAYLEQGYKMKWLALDKTGTITEGKPGQTDFREIQIGQVDAQQYAASLAAHSDHPVSKAIYLHAQTSQITLLDVQQDFKALAGRGIQGIIEKQVYYLGNHRLIEEMQICSPEIETILSNLEKQGKTTVILATDSAVLAIFGVADRVKDTSRKAIAELHALGIRTIMLSGDNQHTVNAIAKEVGIDAAKGEQLPEDKQSSIKEMSDRGMVVGMVGDGINDAPALAQADIGFAMGAAGTDTAIETADVAIMDDDLHKIPVFIRLSNATHSILVQNIALALGIKLVFLVLTLMGYGTMWMAVFADMGASLLVVFNGLRLLKK